MGRCGGAGNIIRVTDDDWRLTGQETYLAGRVLRWADWTPPRGGWEHDHCAFCWAEFAASKTDHVDYTAGYVTDDDNYYWVCPQCFNDFRVRFGWTVVSTPQGD